MQKMRFGDVKAVADFYDCHPSTVWRMAKAGVIPAPVKIGNLTRWDMPALEADHEKSAA